MTTSPLPVTKRRRRRQRYHAPQGLNSLSILLLCIFLFGCHCVDVTSQEADNVMNSDNNDKTKLTITEVTLDVASAEMARRLMKRMKEVKDSLEKKKNDDDDDDSDDVGRKSWDTLIKVMDHLASSSSSEQIDKETNNNNDTTATIQNIHHHHLSQNEARKRALYWLSHQDTYEQKEVGTGFLHRYALAVIYFSLEGDSWNRCSSASHSGTGSIKANDCPTDNERYLSSASHRLWDGVNGNRDDTITWLDLSNRNVYSEQFLPLELTLLTPTLELLWVSENPDLSGTLPEYMGEFQKLESLNVHKTSVGGTLPDSLYTLRKLSSLRLYKSKFTGSISSNIGNMGRLKWLWIHENEFTGVVPEEIGKLKKLEGVTLHGNKFVPIVKEEVQEVEKRVQELTHEELEKRVQELKEELAMRKGEEVMVQKKEEAHTPKEDKTLRRKLTDVDEKKDTTLEGLNHHKNMNVASDTTDVKDAIEDAKDDPLKTESQPKPDEKIVPEVTLEGQDKPTESTETEDWKSALKGNIIPESLCSLMKQKKLKHLWTDCEEDALEQHKIKGSVHACSCCTRCFPKKAPTANAAVE
eukprot:scaffold5990_cov143-Skeletonema_marinoi.AAC.9